MHMCARSNTHMHMHIPHLLCLAHSTHPRTTALLLLTALQVVVTADDGIRPGATAASLASLRTVFKKDGTTTAGNSSQVCSHPWARQAGGKAGRQGGSQAACSCTARSTRTRLPHICLHLPPHTHTRLDTIPHTPGD